MSDEYASSGYKGSLVNDSAKGAQNTDAETGNYPPEGDSTSSGGYGSSVNTFAPETQRGKVDTGAGLVQQSTSGGDLESEIDDAKQGEDAGTRKEVGKGQGLNPYPSDSLENRKEAEEALSRQFE
ncbi:hypothetical protein PLICRDRAFT_167848, partial [Plicaturopsis crispa FD-325 SS-3]